MARLSGTRPHLTGLGCSLILLNLLVCGACNGHADEPADDSSSGGEDTHRDERKPREVVPPLPIAGP